MTQLSLPFPAVETEQSRLNLEAVADAGAKRFSRQNIYFTFDTSDLNKAKKIVTVPKNSIIIGVDPIRVEDAFDALDSVLFIGTSENRASIGKQEVNVSGPYKIDWVGSEQTKFLQLLDRPTDVLVVVSDESGTSTKGKGWGLLEYINLDRI